MDSLSIQENRLRFFKEKIKEQLELIKDDLGALRYKLYIAMVDECNNYDDLRDMAELEMQINMIEYTRKEIKSKLTESNTDIKELRLVCDENYKNQVQQEIDSEEESSRQEIDIAEALQDEETSTAMAHILMMRLATEPLEETYRDEIGSAFDKKPELSDLDSITDSDFSDAYTEETATVETIKEDDIEVEIEEASLFDEETTDEESKDEEEFEINEEDLLGGDVESTEEDEFEINVEDLLGNSETPNEMNDTTTNNGAEAEITEADVFDDDDDKKDETSDEIEIDESELFSEDEGDTEFSINEEDLLGEDDNGDKTSDEETNEYDIDENDLLGEDADESSGELEFEISEDDIFVEDEDETEETKTSGEIEFDISEDDVFVEEEEDKTAGIDDIEVEEEETETSDDDDMFSELNEADIEDSLFEDDLDGYTGNKPSTVDKKSESETKKAVKPVVTPQTTFNNGTERGQKSQQMFNWIHSVIGKTEKVVAKTSETTQKVVKTKIQEVGKHDMFNLRDDEPIDF